MPKTIMVTGGAGFIGSRFVHYILDKYPDYRIIVLDALTYAGSLDNLPKGLAGEDLPRLQFWYGDVRNGELVGSLIEESDYVVHFAAETHVTRSIFDNQLFFQTDVLGTQVIANAILKAGSRIKRFVHISTSEVYGSACTEVMTEDHPLNPMSPYASAKTGADRLVYSYWATYGIPAVILRPFNNYGANQHLEKVIPRFITSVLLDEPLTVHGDGSSMRDFLHVDDTCQAVDLLLHAPAEKVVGEVFNVASGKHKSILEIAHEIARRMNFPAGKIVRIGDRLGQVFRHTGSTSKIAKVVGWDQKISWDEGLNRTIEWFRRHRSIWEKQIPMRHILIRTARGKKELH